MYTIIILNRNITKFNIIKIRLANRRSIVYNEEGRRSIRQTGRCFAKAERSGAVDDASRHQFSRQPASGYHLFAKYGFGEKHQIERLLPESLF